MSYRAKSKGSYGNQHHSNRSISSIQASRSARSRAMDLRLRAPIAKNEDQWMNDPSHYDLPDVDLPKPKSETVVAPEPEKQIWKLRNIYKMNEDELQDYLNKLERIRAYNNTPYDARIREERQAVDRALKDLRNARKEKLLDSAKNGRLTYENTPDDNPFYYHQGGSYYSTLSGAELQENENNRQVSPYIEAKQETEKMVEQLDKLGYPHDSEVVFSKLVDYHKERSKDWQKAKHPYQEQLEQWNKTTDYMPEVKNVAERKLAKDGSLSDEQVFEEFSHRDRQAVKVALDRVAKEEGWVKENGKIKAEATGGIQKPKTNGLKVLNDLGAFEEVQYGEDKKRQIVVDIEGGKAKTRFMDPSRIAMFEGEVDVSDIPGLGKSKGKKVIGLNGGDDIAFNRPDYAYISSKDKDGENIVLKKFDVKQVRNWKETDENYNRVPKHSETKVAKKFIINLRDATENDVEKQNELPIPRFTTTGNFTISGKDLKELTKAEKRGTQNYEDAIKIFVDKTKATLVRYPKREEHKTYYQHGPTETYYTTQDVKPLVIKGESSGTEKRTRGVFSRQYLQALADLAEPNEKIKISYASDMPMEAKLNNSTVKGSFFLAPRIETED